MVRSVGNLVRVGILEVIQSLQWIMSGIQVSAVVEAFSQKD